MIEGRIGIGLLGAGAMGTMHAEVYARLPDVRVVGVVSRDQQRAGRAAALCGAEAFADADSLIGNPAVDAVDVCLPTAAHPAVVTAALERGKHVFCETPLALRLDDARRMRDAARRVGRLLQVGLLMRSVAAYLHVKAAQASGSHGRLLGLTTYRLSSYLRAGTAEHKAHYSDPSTELMTFDFDVVSWLMGPPASLSACAVPAASGGPGEISALLAYDDGRYASVLASGLMPQGSPFSVGFRALFERAAFQLTSVFEDGPPRTTFTVAAGDAPPQPVVLDDRNPYDVELRRFVDCLRGRADPQLLDVDRAIEALGLSTATQRALQTGDRVAALGDLMA
ncbi:MAG: Gfo/Idh/MocA family oxidoreductase [Alphaproteobacteria bacterium]|nr:Gfo/Idh/MocA family oxidoreductase [Alphaproteobacteria bacterium]